MDDLHELRAFDAVARMHLHALVVFLFADMRVNELLGDRERKFQTGRLANEMQHHIECGRSARASKDVTLYDVELLSQSDRRIARPKQVAVFPMHGATAIRQEAGICKNEGAAADAADAASEPPQQMVDLMITPKLQRFEPRAHDHHVDLAQALERMMDRHGNAVARHDRLAVDRSQLPLEEPALADAIGRAQRFNRGGKRHHRELGGQQKGQSQGLAGGLSQGGSRPASMPNRAYLNPDSWPLPIAQAGRHFVDAEPFLVSSARH